MHTIFSVKPFQVYRTSVPICYISDWYLPGITVR